MTPTQQTIYNYLHSGAQYAAQDLALLADCEDSSVAMHVSRLRKKLRGTALDVVFRDGKYSLVRTASYRG